MRPALSTGTNSGPGSGPRTVSQAAIASLAPFVAYMIRALFCQGETGLVRGVRELAVRRPAVADLDAAVAGAGDRGGLGVAAAGLDGVDGHVARDEDPEPPQPPADFPPGLVGGNDRTATTSAWAVGVLRAATRCSACTRPPGVIVSPQPVRRIVATFKAMQRHRAKRPPGGRRET